MRGRKPNVPPLGDVVDLPISQVRIPPAPSYLSPDAKKIWDKTARILVQKNIYDVDCEQMLGAYCAQYARWIEADAEVQRRGQMIKSKKGAPTYNPYVSMSNNAYDKMVRLASELGLTPVARKRAVKTRSTVAVAASKYLKSAS